MSIDRDYLRERLLDYGLEEDYTERLPRIVIEPRTIHKRKTRRHKRPSIWGRIKFWVWMKLKR
jgi:hypothetical protein